MNHTPNIPPIPVKGAAAAASAKGGAAVAAAVSAAGGAAAGIGGAYIAEKINEEPVEIAEIDETVAPASPKEEVKPEPVVSDQPETPSATAEVTPAAETPAHTSQPAAEQPAQNVTPSQPAEQPVAPVEQPVANNEPIKIDDLDDVDPMLLADELADVELIDTEAAGDPRFFTPTDYYQATNISGQQEAVVAAQLPTGEQVFLVDSNQDGAFERVTDVNGNILADGDDLVATTVDDAIAVLNDGNGYAGDVASASELPHGDAPVMAGVDEVIVPDGAMPVDYTAETPVAGYQEDLPGDYTFDTPEIIEA